MISYRSQVCSLYSPIPRPQAMNNGERDPRLDTNIQSSRSQADDVIIILNHDEKECAII